MITLPCGQEILAIQNKVVGRAVLGTKGFMMPMYVGRKYYEVKFSPVRSGRLKPVSEGFSTWIYYYGMDAKTKRKCRVIGIWACVSVDGRITDVVCGTNRPDTVWKCPNLEYRLNREYDRINDMIESGTFIHNIPYNRKPLRDYDWAQEVNSKWAAYLNFQKKRLAS